MMRRLFVIAALFAALALPAAAQQAPSSFSPNGATTLSVSGSSARVAFPTPGPSSVIVNTGAQTAYLAFGSSSVSATTSGYLLAPGCSGAFDIRGQPDVAAITSTGTTSLSIYTGSGLPTLPQSGCVPGSGGGGTPTPVTPAATTTTSTSALAANLVVNAAASNLYSFTISADSTLSAAPWYAMIYNATSAPADGAVSPYKCYPMPSGATGISAAFPNPISLSTGIVLGVSTTGCFTKTGSTHASFISGDYR